MHCGKLAHAPNLPSAAWALGPGGAVLVVEQGAARATAKDDFGVPLTGPVPDVRDHGQ